MRLYKKLVGSVGLVIVVIALMLAPTRYYLVMPGSAENLNELIVVENGHEDEGSFHLVTVYQRRANVIMLLYGSLSRVVDVVPMANVIPPDMDRDEYSRLMMEWMEDSQLLAKVIALRQVGYEVPITSEGVEIVGVVEGSPAEDILFPEDIVKRIDGQEVSLAEEMIDLVQARQVGDEVALTIERDGEVLNYSFTTVGLVEEPDKAAIRVYIRSLNWEPVLPVDIDIITGKISGPSAGMMFVLEIINKLSEEDITGGRVIAGTGTVNLQGEIGSIGGTKQKVVAAEREGAQVFLVPQKNYEQAQSVKSDIEIVPVDTLSEVLEYLGFAG